MESVKSMSYEELETQWGGMLHKFAQWNVPGMDYDDVKQELRLVLHKAQQNYRPRSKASFTTYLYRALLNKTRKLADRSSAKKRVPTGLLLPLCSDDHPEDGWCLACSSPPFAVDDHGILETIGFASYEAKQIALMSLRGENTKACWTESGLSDEQIKNGLRELRGLLRPNERSS